MTSLCLQVLVNALPRGTSAVQQMKQRTTLGQRAASPETIPNQGARAPIMQQTYQSSFSAVAKPILTSEHSFSRTFQIIFMEIRELLHRSKFKRLQNAFRGFLKFVSLFSVRSVFDGWRIKKQNPGRRDLSAVKLYASYDV